MEKKEYIERGVLMYRLGYYYGHTSGEPKYAYGVALKEVHTAPAADVVEVVRCKDCKHRDPEDKLCEHYRNDHFWMRKDDDYCSYGERKEE